MTQVSIGDMAQSFMLRRQNTELKSQMGRLVQELSSGRTADLARHLSGSYSYLADVERNLLLLDGYSAATGEAQVFTSAMQDALGNVQDFATDLGLAALTSASSHLPQAVNATSTRAVGDFKRMIASLNTNVGGRTLFAGVDTDTPALAGSDVILADLRLALAGQTDATGVMTVMDSWFDTPGGGFDTIAYTGSATSLLPFSLGPGESVDLDLRADDPAVRQILKHAALAALASDPALAFDSALQEELLQTAGEGLSFRQAALTQIRADLGYAQARIEENSARISSERTGYEIARTELLAIDPYEAATHLEDVQFQLESLYAVTVRLSRLSLVDFL